MKVSMKKYFSHFYFIALLVFINPSSAFSDTPARSCPQLLDSRSQTRNLLTDVSDACSLVASISARALCLSSGITQGEFSQIRDIAEEVLDQFPPTEYFYVGLGRSPTPIIAYFHATGIQGARNLPLSGFRLYPPSENRDHSHQTLFVFWEGKILNHFRLFLPTLEELGDKKIILIDYAQFGESLSSARAYLNKYYDGLGRGDLVQAVALTGNSTKLIPDLDDQYIINLNKFNSVKFSMLFQFYEKYAEFGKFDFTEQRSENLIRNSLYVELVENFRSRIIPK